MSKKKKEIANAKKGSCMNIKEITSTCRNFVSMQLKHLTTYLTTNLFIHVISKKPWPLVTSND